MEKWLYLFKRKRRARVIDYYEHRSKIVLTPYHQELENMCKLYFVGKLNVPENFSYQEFESLSEVRQFLLMYNTYSELQFLVELNTQKPASTSPTLF